VQIQFDTRVAAKAASTALALFLAGCDPAAEVPAWGSLPDFSLINQDTKAYGTAQLEGRPWVANFIFTKCPGRCPMLTREMSRLQTELSGRGWDDVMLVSISVDPANDTPEALTHLVAQRRRIQTPGPGNRRHRRGSDPAQQPLRTCGWPAADSRLLRRLRCRRSRQVAARSRNRPRRAHVGDPLTREPFRLALL